MQTAFESDDFNFLSHGVNQHAFHRVFALLNFRHVVPIEAVASGHGQPIWISRIRRLRGPEDSSWKTIANRKYRCTPGAGVRPNHPLIAGARQSGRVSLRGAPLEAESHCVRVAILRDLLDRKQVFAIGGHFLIHKPASAMQIERCLRAAYSATAARR